MATVETFTFEGLGAEAREKAIDKLRETRRYAELHNELHADTLYQALDYRLEREGVDASIRDVIVDGEDVDARVWVESAPITLGLLRKIGSHPYLDDETFRLVCDIVYYGNENLYYYRTPDDGGDVFLDDIDTQYVARELYGTMVVGELGCGADDEFVAAMGEYETEIIAAMDRLEHAIYAWIHDIIDDFEDEARHNILATDDDFLIRALCEETLFTADGTPTEVA